MPTIDNTATSGSILSLLQDPKVLASLMAAGGAGALGAGLSYASKGPENETREERRKRILRNAGLAATLGGGGVAAGMYGLNQFATALPADDVAPGAGIAGVVGRGLGATAGFGIWNKATGKSRNRAAAQVLKEMGIDLPTGKGELSPIETLRRNIKGDEFAEYAKRHGNNTDKLDMLRNTGIRDAEVRAVTGQRSMKQLLSDGFDDSVEGVNKFRKSPIKTTGRALKSAPDYVGRNLSKAPGAVLRSARRHPAAAIALGLAAPELLGLTGRIGGAAIKDITTRSN
jgi:hypothetical protein